MTGDVLVHICWVDADETVCRHTWLVSWATLDLLPFRRFFDRCKLGSPLGVCNGVFPWSGLRVATHVVFTGALEVRLPARIYHAVSYM